MVFKYVFLFDKIHISSKPNAMYSITFEDKTNYCE